MACGGGSPRYADQYSAGSRSIAVADQNGSLKPLKYVGVTRSTSVTDSQAVLEVTRRSGEFSVKLPLFRGDLKRAEPETSDLALFSADSP